MSDSDILTKKQKELTELRKSEDRKNIRDEIEQIEAKIKNRWLKNEIKRIDLPDELENAISEIEEKTGFRYLEDLEEQIQIIILLDGNVENSYSAVLTASALVISGISFLISTLSLTNAINPEWLKNVGHNCIILLLFIALAVIVSTLKFAFPRWEKHVFKKYAREKTFYEVFLKAIERLKKGEEERFNAE